MVDPDYLFAKRLQEQFEYEERTSDHPRMGNGDLQLALLLQEEYQRELEVEKPTDNLVYDSKSTKNSLDSSKCLVDPSWEIIDPTPNIHTLFVAFNERFFWNKLLTVCVSWSKRMTSCAGICSYQGRGGLCSITLSEPLLKLRPRKDLVETLLHEMIHAFLFVTHNNRDRDGHGPEFHKHMHRINKDAGTNITVYHTFHDEVRLYQQHWWRCDGPCQHRKPYFGMVRRAMNRAPGPYDRWWEEHRTTCGGKFIKVKEPEKKQKPQKENKTNKKTDIRNFLPVLQDKSLTQTSLTEITNTKSGTNANNIHGFNTVGGKITNISNISSQVKGDNGLKSNVAKNYVRNSTSTIVVTKKSGNSPLTQSSTSTSKSTAESVFVLSENSQTKADDYSTVRNHWIKKYSNNTNSSKRKSIGVDVESPKKYKLNDVNCSDNNSNSEMRENLVSCPVCAGEFPERSINRHVDECLNNSAIENSEEACIHCDKIVPKSEMSAHVSECLASSFQDDFEIETINCEVCNKLINKNNKEEHLQICLSEAFGDENLTPEQSKCTICGKMIAKQLFDRHAESCLLKKFDEVEKICDSKAEDLCACLVCGKQIHKDFLNKHLDVCMKKVFDEPDDKDDIVIIEDEDKIRHKDDSVLHEFETSFQEGEGNGDKYNCPFCMKLFLEIEMDAHLDLCLKIISGSQDQDKSILIESFSEKF